MRLCLAIHRHGLPPAAVLWTVGSTASATTSAARQTGTVAQLLEHINETIPLEAADWGLEDYVVEVHGFECLHFQEVDSILKDGDHVTYVIRGEMELCILGLIVILTRLTILAFARCQQQTYAGGSSPVDTRYLRTANT